MKIDFTAVLTDLEGVGLCQPTEDAKGNLTGSEELTLGKLCQAALLNLSQDELKLSGVEKQDRFLLALDIREAELNAEVLDLSSEKITLLKQTIGDKYTPIVVGRAYELLDPVETV